MYSRVSYVYASGVWLFLYMCWVCLGVLGGHENLRVVVGIVDDVVLRGVFDLCVRVCVFVFFVCVVCGVSCVCFEFIMPTEYSCQPSSVTQKHKKQAFVNALARPPRTLARLLTHNTIARRARAFYSVYVCARARVHEWRFSWLPRFKRSVFVAFYL